MSEIKFFQILQWDKYTFPMQVEKVFVICIACSMLSSALDFP